MKKQTQLKILNYESGNGFIHKYQKLIRDVVIPYQYDILNDKIPGVEKSHVIANFEIAGKVLRGETVSEGFYGMVFQDSDAAKWLEAAAYSLKNFPDKLLEKTIDSLIDLVAEAQDEDGYLDTYFTIKDQDKRFKNLLEGHELYCAGHMMEAAVAYYETTGKDKLLKVMLKNAGHLYQHFVVDQNPGYPGHPEVELSLMKLYRATGSRQCLELASHFINIRGVDPDFYKKEAAERDWQIWGNDPENHGYQQSAKPVREQKDAVGHSVRAVYLYTGMADLSSETGDEELFSACRTLFDSIVNKRMYVTGAIGSTVLGEAFTVDYDLPNDTVYGETCASIGLMFFASRMLELEADSRYADVMEQAFYNTVLAGMQLDGHNFFYVNPLEVIPGISGEAQTHKHDLPVRPAWYACACCPPNVARLISSIGKYAYAENSDISFCHLYAEGNVKFDNGLELTCSTEYPYGFTVSYEIIKGGKTLAIRIPDWSIQTEIIFNGSKQELKAEKGYIYLKDLKAHDRIELNLDDSVHHIYTSPLVAENTGCTAFKRGPLVYCFEGVDNKSDVLSLSVSEKSKIKVLEYDAELLQGTVPLKISGMRTKQTDALYTMKKPDEENCELVAVPYYTWGNRGLTQMRVWIPEKA